MSEATSSTAGASAVSPPSNNNDEDDDVVMLDGADGGDARANSGGANATTTLSGKETSALWKHFDPSVDPSKAVCKHCKDLVRKKVRLIASF